MGKTTLRGIVLLTLALLLGTCTNPSGPDKKPESVPELPTNTNDGGETWSYTVSFDKNGGDTEANPATKTVSNPATTIDALPGAPPTRAGHTFLGWNTKADGSGSPFGATTKVSGNITVYAQWALIEHNIALILDAGGRAFAEGTFTVYKSGGTGSQSISLAAGYGDPLWEVDGNSIEVPTINAADYTLGRHTLSVRATKDGIIWSKKIDFTVAAGNLRRVLFRSNDGTGAIYALETLTAGSYLDSDFPTPPTRTGYDFASWNTQADGLGATFTNATTVTDDTTVYARWNIQTYTVTFKSNYGANETLYAKPVTVLSPTVSDFPADPTRTDYSFAGWNTAADGSGTAFGQTTVVAGDMTVYAQWARAEFNITLGLDAGDGAFTEVSFTVYKSGGTGSKTLDLAGSGYTNPRWFVDGDLKATETSITIGAVDYGVGNHTLTLLVNKSGVSWSREIPFTVEAGDLRRVLFRSNDGTGAIYALKTLTVGSDLDSDFPTPPTRTGYDFASWNTQADGLGATFTDATTVTDDTTVYARWNIQTYTVTFKSNYGTNETLYAKQVTVLSPTVSDFPADPTRTDYNFAGWNTAADGSGTAFGQTTVVAGNMMVYAQWAFDEFNITLNLDAGNDAFAGGTFTVYKSGGTGSQTLNLASGYTNPRWFVDGDLKATEPGITIDAAEYGAGKHHLTLLATRNGVSWSKEISFTVTTVTE
jgi:uncharacterized repeat protein (TIGR02543 family)